MTKKDYKLIADAIRFEREEWTNGVPQEVLDRLVAHLSQKLGNQNPKFDKAKFLEASSLSIR